VTIDDLPWQEIHPRTLADLRVRDLTAWPEPHREAEVQRRIEALILQPTNLVTEPLFGAELLKLGESHHVLILAVEHIVCDAYSLDILHSEVLAAHAQFSTKRTLHLPEVPLQFSDYAQHQISEERRWLQTHVPYWNRHLLGNHRVRFPERTAAPAAASEGWGVISLRIDRELKASLVQWCRSNRTSIAMGVFTAYAALVLCWCDVPEAIIRYQGHGRPHPETYAAVGFFASRLYLRIELSRQDSFVDLLRRITVEYCNAHEHDDFAYLETRQPRPEFASNTFFNWIPATDRSSNPKGRGIADPIATSRIPFTNPWFAQLQWDNEPMTLLHDEEEVVTGGVYFPLQQLSMASMERFARNLLLFVATLVQQSQQPIRAIALL
jgi:hypothetical protein